MEKQFKVNLEFLGGMQFRTTFDLEHFPPLMFDEPPSVPGGKGEYPNASRILASAVANCLSASLVFCLAKSKVPLDGLQTEVVGTIARNEAGYWRIKKLDVKLFVQYDQINDTILKKFERCKDIFFNYCIVSASIKEGIEINVDADLVTSA